MSSFSVLEAGAKYIDYACLGFIFFIFFYVLRFLSSFPFEGKVPRYIIIFIVFCPRIVLIDPSILVRGELV